jgi:NTP pyrophosphatase (non-canonical NTP hydrolase)
MDTFNKEFLKDLYTFSKAQEERKARLGKAGYARRKLDEELGELGESIDNQEGTARIIEEFGDVLFSMMLVPDWIPRLQKRMEFNRFRAEQFAALEIAGIRIPGLKLSQTEGWYIKEGKGS